MEALKIKLSKNNFLLAILTLCILGSCSESNKEDPVFKDESTSSSQSKYLAFEEYAYADTNNKSNNAFRDFESYKMQFDTLHIDNRIFYIVEGDLLLDLDELKVEFKRMNKPEESRKLVILVDDGIPLRIDNPHNIRYAIIKQSFSVREYAAICRYFEDAASDWKKVCNVNFVHISELDDRLQPTENPEEVTFVVRKIGYSSDGLLASSFFPYDGKDERKVLITPAFFQTSFDKTGILRHEIGHILGFRHEHIRSGAPAICPSESKDFIWELTNYDPRSVMHYFCGGSGTINLKITYTDSIGASMIYPYNH